MRALDYLQSHFKFRDCLSQKLGNFSLHEKLPSIDNFTTVLEMLPNLAQAINVDILFEEVMALAKHFDNRKDNTPHWKELPTCDKWRFLLKAEYGEQDFFNLSKILSYLLSIPASSAYVERVFSVMAQKWREERNKASIELIKNELIIYFNLNISCLEFYEKKNKNNIELFRAAKSNTKYKFKFQS